jgi:hypothetical protein
MTGTKLSDLNQHLFAQLDRMAGDMKPDQIEQEVKRAGAIVEVARQITDNANLQLKAAKLFADHGAGVLEHLPMIGKAQR